MKKYLHTIVTGASLSILLFGIFLYFNYQQPTNELLVAGIYLLVLYFLLFTTGHPLTTEWIKKNTHSLAEKSLIFPVILIALLYSYMWAHGFSPFQGTAALFPFFFLFPVLGFLAFKKTQVVWSDFIILLFFLIPATLISFKNGTGLPVNGVNFGSVYKIIIVLMGVYAFGVIRGIKDIGFYPEFNLKYLGTAILCWVGFIGLVFLVAYTGGFVRLAATDSLISKNLPEVFRNFTRIFIGTALFEELYFRGLIQNMLKQKIGRYTSWHKSWQWGFGIFLVLALITGYLMNKPLFWFPVLITILLFLAAFIFEKRQIQPQGTYVALAITSIFFGLVHFHAGSVIFVGLASVAGWAYGYTYLKTNNVFYAALVHTLVNSSEFLFALDGLK
ncbi:CPBP family intramembrane glutamic endopeptidase [Emticicia sp. 17c]|uniref:CPBP family intramembrane glutamic endopeptidase n=1 Tax=Emticicia sp. 17c TaxID=3127704 RepID=UPI00301D83C3